MLIHDLVQPRLDGGHGFLPEPLAFGPVIRDVVRGFGPGVDQDCLYLYLAPQPFELYVLDKRRARFIQADCVVDGLIALVRVFLGRMMDSRLIPVHLEILRNEPRVEESLYVGVGIEDQPSAREVLDFIFDGG
jgi:hypothetical protein